LTVKARPRSLHREIWEWIVMNLYPQNKNTLGHRNTYENRVRSSPLHRDESSGRLLSSSQSCSCLSAKMKPTIAAHMPPTPGQPDGINDSHILRKVEQFMTPIKRQSHDGRLGFERSMIVYCSPSVVMISQATKESFSFVARPGRIQWLMSFTRSSRSGFTEAWSVHRKIKSLFVSTSSSHYS